MPQLTVIANIPSSVLHMSFAGEPTTRLIAQLFSGNPDATSIPRLQIASPEFKKRLFLMDAIGERAYTFKQFFNQIPDNNHFLVLLGHISDQIEIYLRTKELAGIDGMPLTTNAWESIATYLYEHYEVFTFNGEKRLSVGVDDKAKRVCRFCGRSMPDAKFRQKAHAISESLGNKGLVCREECDDCNRRFNQTIEQDVTRMFQFFLILKGIKGKNGNPTLQGDSISITNDQSSRSTLGRDTLVLRVKTMPDTHNPQEIAKFISDHFSFSNVKYIPQNIYKCFCKYVLSVIGHEYLPYFKTTIDWINEPLTHHRLPPIWYYGVPNSSDAPYLVVMLRKHNSKEIPYCWAIFNIAGYQYMFILPFCSRDRYKFVGKNRVQFFLDGLKKVMPNINFQPMKFDGIKPISLKVNAKFNISPDCVEGRDYYFIDPKNKSSE